DLAEGKLVEARSGIQRAQAALAEAVGVETPCEKVLVADTKLPLLNPPVCRQQIIDLALKRRAEVRLAWIGLQVTSLEVDAKDASHGYSASTFAQGSDIHARPVPEGKANGEYAPGAVGIEMPAVLYGCKAARVEQVTALRDRALAVYEKTKRLV